MKTVVTTAALFALSLPLAASADIQIKEAGPYSQSLDAADYTLSFTGEDARMLHAAFGTRSFKSKVMLQSVSCDSEESCTVVLRAKMYHPRFCKGGCSEERWSTNYGVNLRPIISRLSDEGDRALLSPIQGFYLWDKETYTRNHARLYERMDRSKSALVTRTETESGTVLRAQTERFSLVCIQYRNPVMREQDDIAIPHGAALKSHLFQDTHFCLFTTQLRLSPAAKPTLTLDPTDLEVKISYLSGGRLKPATGVTVALGGTIYENFRYRGAPYAVSLTDTDEQGVARFPVYEYRYPDVVPGGHGIEVQTTSIPGKGESIREFIQKRYAIPGCSADAMADIAIYYVGKDGELMLHYTSYIYMGVVTEDTVDPQGNLAFTVKPGQKPHLVIATNPYHLADKGPGKPAQDIEVALERYRARCVAEAAGR